MKIPSDMKDINISDWIFIPSPGSCPRGGTWEYLGVGRGGGSKIYFFQNSSKLGL